MIDPCSLEAKPLLSLAEALAILEAAVQPISGSEKVGLNVALGRVLVEDVLSPINLPANRNSAMDGYAIASQHISSNQSVILKQVGISWAGKPYQGRLQAGECVRIFTGAVIPEEADSVVIQEDVLVEGNSVQLPAGIKPRQNIREAGEDCQIGDKLCPRQKTITPADLGLLAAVGIAEVTVYRKLQVAFFSTGDELTPVGQTLEAGKIYESNRYALSALLHNPNHVLTDLGVIPDDKALLEGQLTTAAQSHDVILSTGGASVGEADFLQPALAHCGEIGFWKIAVKPGKPLAFGKIKDCYVFGLPGNPVSMMVTFQQIVAPALRLLAGAMAKKPLRLKAICTTPLRKSAGRQEFQRGILHQNAAGEWLVASVGKQGSHLLTSMSRANCYIVLPTESEGCVTGDLVEVQPFEILI